MRKYGMHCTLDFCPRPARKESNVPRLKSRKGLTVLIYILCSLLPCLVRSLLKNSMKTYASKNICKCNYM